MNLTRITSVTSILKIRLDTIFGMNSIDILRFINASRYSGPRETENHFESKMLNSFVPCNSLN